MEINQFHLSSFLKFDEKFHLARVNINSSLDLSLHSHDYIEMFWIERGSGEHFINGTKIKLNSGDLVMMRPNDTHTFSSKGKGLSLINVAFSLETLEIYRARYFNDSQLYFWSKSNFPFQMKLNENTIKRMSARAEESMKNYRSFLQLDSLLLFIFLQITVNEKTPIDSEIPLWLSNAVQNYNNPASFKLGVRGFADLCEKNINYVNRIVKNHYNKTLTELVNEFKMQYATNQLIMTSMPIKVICSNCGFENIAHFYKVFKSRFNQTPKVYRKMNQMIV